MQEARQRKCPQISTASSPSFQSVWGGGGGGGDSRPDSYEDNETTDEHPPRNCSLG